MSEEEPTPTTTTTEEIKTEETETKKEVEEVEAKENEEEEKVKEEESTATFEPVVRLALVSRVCVCAFRFSLFGRAVVFFVLVWFVGWRWCHAVNAALRALRGEVAASNSHDINHVNSDFVVSTGPVKLEEVEVKSGEEDEEIICSYRSKLFLYGETLLDKGTGNKTWKERGIGEARILRHRQHQRLRFLMRQEKTMKVIANHALDPRIQLEPNAGSDRSWVWSCYDFAEGELEEKVFALRFANSEVAVEFKNKYEECQKEMEKLLAGEDKPDVGGEAAEVAEALGGLKTNEE
ncbi:hypothetical protein HJC23_011017 [Cyclotella cryptica]|uniref:RanBD1 domain-containing protein n=1 Tax=Cyclotella cryptica TaxID=29204 RepID=A0ABD3PGQ5_9STRA